MEDSAIIAKLTLMVLRASILRPEAVGEGRSIVIKPDTSRISKDEAVRRLAGIRGPVAFSVEDHDGILAIQTSALEPDDEVQMENRVDIFAKGLRQIDATSSSETLLEVQGFDESMIVPIRLLKAWLESGNFRRCSLSLSRPTALTRNGVFGV